MVGTNKVLTVSYGTFSCTLEGFDDSFSTMKAIAEYFRDLAADDRYFGAEPPTPDAEMLARIAQREISRNVEAKVGEHGVVLRATPGTTELAPAGTPPVAEPQPQDAQPEQPTARAADTDVTDADAADQALAATAPVSEALTEFEPVEPGDDLSSVAAKLRRIRSVVQHAEATATPSIYNEDEDAAAFFDGTDNNAQPIEDAQPSDPEDTTEADQGFEAEAEVETEVETEAEDEAEITAEADASADDQDTDETTADISNVITKLAMTDDASDDFEEDEAADTSDISFDAADADTATDDDAGTDEDEDKAHNEDVIDFAALTAVRDEADKDAEAAHDDDTAEKAGQDDEDHSEPLVLHEADTADETVNDAVKDTETSLSDEQEADLMAELAGVEADSPTETAEDKADADATDDTPEHAVTTTIRRERRTVLTEGNVNDDASLTRILKHTNSEMQSGEGTRRRAAIAHLKAAVAATVADRKSGGTSKNDPAEEAAPYREDLAEVVRPRRRMSKGTQQRPPMAPLMLVSEQRIDKPVTSGETHNFDIHPRRITKGNLAYQLDDADHDESDAQDNESNVFGQSAFAAFAAEKGATQLPDLLEAAAAYACFVEGRPHFSRPQVMKEAARAQADGGFTREEGLRSFGTLLRQGKIRKLKRGQFVITDNTRFKPKAG